MFPRVITKLSAKRCIEVNKILKTIQLIRTKTHTQEKRNKAKADGTNRKLNAKKI